jgi:SAM-dependent methyltransferase
MNQLRDDSRVLSWVGSLHHAFVFGRRVRVLTKLLAQQIPPSAKVLDIGCGDGTIGNMLGNARSDIQIEGVEINVRSECRIPCSSFDGRRLPFADDTFDLCLLVDVLHHTEDIASLLKEAARVSRAFVLLKDHLSNNLIDHATLRFMDWVGNRPYRVSLPYNYASRSTWDDYFSTVNMRPISWREHLPIYPFPLGNIFGRALHFVTLLEKSTRASMPTNG